MQARESDTNHFLNQSLDRRRAQGTITCNLAHLPGTMLFSKALTTLLAPWLFPPAQG